MIPERYGRIRKTRRTAIAVFAILASFLIPAPDASAQVSGWHTGAGTSEAGPRIGLSWNGYSHVGAYQWPPTPDCNCADMCAGLDPNDPNQVCPCDPAMCVQNPWQMMGQSPVQWFSYSPVNPTAATFPPPAHTISVTGMSIGGLQAQSAATANDPDGYVIASAGGAPSSLAMGATHIFTPPVTSLTLSGHDPNNVMILFGLIFTAPTGPSATITVTPEFNPPNYPPVAEAGSNQTVNPGQITLDGTASYDLEGELVSYFWTQVPNGAPTVDIIGQSDVNPTVTLLNPAGVSGNTVYVFNLIVMDVGGTQHTDTVTITVNNMSTPAGDPVLTGFNDPNNPADPLFDQMRSVAPGGDRIAPAVRQPRQQLQPRQQRAPQPVPRKN